MVVIALLLLVAWLWCLYSHKREGYGGVIKKIRRIPLDDCKKICQQYKNKCLAQYSDTDPGWCEELFGDGCEAECYYSKYHRM